MRLIHYLILIFCFSVATSFASPVFTDQMKRFSVELEGQSVWQGRNDARIPGSTGSTFSLKDALQSPRPGIRVEASYQFLERHQLRVVFAPLSFTGSGRLTQSVSFQGITFNSTNDIEGHYQFNSYRLTYRYAFLQDHERWRIMFGLTGKVRDATIGLKQGTFEKEKSNVGFVPLLHGAVAYIIGSGWQTELEFDALAAPQGRAEDLRLGLRKTFQSGLSALVGYRLLEGGADNSEVYTFSFFQYAVASLSYVY